MKNQEPMPLISVVSPVYRAENIVEELVRQIKAAVSPITENFEIILVNDASPDASWERISAECAKDNRVKGINLSRNFGQHYAITAGLSAASGEWNVVMDCDLQDRPEEISKLYKKALEGFDIVYARRLYRIDNLFKRASSALFHIAYNYLSGLKTDKAIANFGIYHRKVIAEFNKMPERARSFPSLVASLGFKSTAIPVKHASRYAGETTYSLMKLLKLSFDVTISNSNKPLHLAVELGLAMAFLSFVLALYNLIAYFTGIIRVPGFTTTIFSIWFVGGLLLAMLGVVGLYVGKIFDQVKGRPLFIISEKINLP